TSENLLCCISLYFLMIPTPPISTLFPYTTLFRSQDNHEYPFLYQRQTCHQVQPNQATYQKRQKCQPATYLQEVLDLVGLGGKSEIGRAVQQECRDRSRMPSSA